MLRYSSRNTRGTTAGWLTPYRRPAAETDVTCSLDSYYIIWDFWALKGKNRWSKAARWYRSPNTNGTLKNTLLRPTYRVQIVQIRKLMGSIVQCNIPLRPHSPSSSRRRRQSFSTMETKNAIRERRRLVMRNVCTSNRVPTILVSFPFCASSSKDACKKWPGALGATDLIHRCHCRACHPSPGHSTSFEIRDPLFSTSTNFHRD